MQCGKPFRTSGQRRIHVKMHSRNYNGPTGKRRLLRIGDFTSPPIDLPDPLQITSEGTRDNLTINLSIMCMYCASIVLITKAIYA